MNIDHYQVFLFDFDGLLVDTEPLHFQAFCDACEQFQIQFPGHFLDYYHYIALGRVFLKEYLKSHYPNIEVVWDDLYHVKQERYQYLLKVSLPQLTKGAEDFLRYLFHKQKKVVVVTNASTLDVQPFQEYYPVLNQISHWVVREMYTNPKPSPDSYQKAYELFVQTEDHVIGFEDSMKGLRALAGTNASLVAINELLPMDQSMNEEFSHREKFVFSSFEEILSLQHNK